MKLYLIGLLGSGKSFLGKKIAELAKLPFIDLDEATEEHEGMKVSEIFAAKGEAYFRMTEAAVLRKRSELGEFVMATGGGAPCFHDNMKFINLQGISVFLNTPVNEIAKRLAGNQRKSRPLLDGIPDHEIEAKLDQMLHKRLIFYEQAQASVTGTSVTANEILQLVSAKK